MPKVKIEIELGNDAMRRPCHVKNALTKLAEKIGTSHLYDHTIMDLNGNSVGRCWREDEEPRHQGPCEPVKPGVVYVDESQQEDSRAKEPSCADRIRKHLDRELEEVRKAWQAHQNGEDPEEEYTIYGEGRKTVSTLILSGGGPSSQWEVTFDDDNVIEQIDYVFKDWFDGARLTLEGEEFDLVHEFLKAYHYGME